MKKNNTNSKRPKTNSEELKLWKLETKTGTLMEEQTKGEQEFPSSFTVKTNLSDINTRLNNQLNLNLYTFRVS